MLAELPVELFEFSYCVSLVPFDEDDRDDSVWFLDHDYLENMYGMFKKVNGEQHLKMYTHTAAFLYSLHYFSLTAFVGFFQQEKELSGGTTQDPSCTKMTLPSTSLSNSTVPTRYVTSYFTHPRPSYVTSGVELFIHSPLFILQVLVIIDVKPKDLGLPTEAYISVEEIHDVSRRWMTNTNSLFGPSN